MALAQLVLLWLGAGVEQGQVSEAGLGSPAPLMTTLPHFKKGKAEQGNGESKSVLCVPWRYSVCCGFSKQLLTSLVV